VFLGCSDVDPHIPAPRVAHTAEVLARLGASVTARLYPGMGHTINDDELEAVRQMMRRIA
jgi:predicted esterase